MAVVICLFAAIAVTFSVAVRAGRPLGDFRRREGRTRRSATWRHRGRHGPDRHKLTTVTNQSGVFSFPSVSTGTYKVSLTLSGFKQTVLDSVVVVAASARVRQYHHDRWRHGREGRSRGEHGAHPVTVDDGCHDPEHRLDPKAADDHAQRDAVVAGDARRHDQTGGDRSATINGLPQNAVKLTIDGIDVKPVQGTTRRVRSTPTSIRPPTRWRR